MVKLLNTQTGKIAIVDPKTARVKRLQRRVHGWAKRIDPLLQRVGYDYRLVMVRLSYSPDRDWSPGDIRSFILKLHYHLGKNLLAYAWVAELFKRAENGYQRGCVHYHLILLVKRGTNIPEFDTVGWWPNGYTRRETARSPFYIVSYTKKSNYQKLGDFPKHIRIFGVWISPDCISKNASWLFRLSALPKWLAEDVFKDGQFGKLPQRVRGGGWICGGQMYYSPWQVLSFDG